MMKHFFFLILLISSFESFAYKPVKVMDRKGIIWGFDFLSDTEILYNRRRGKTYYYNFETKETKKLDSPKAKTTGQGGLLDLKIHKANGKTYVYFTYSVEENDVNSTALARGIYKDKSISDIKQLFKTKTDGWGGRHFGSRILIYDDFIYMTMGERGERDAAQKLKFHNGKILRLNMDGTAAKGNPFDKEKGALPEIWTYGHRNPQGIALDPVSKKIYSCEMGPRGGDELNLIEAGANYGWPVITYGKEYWGPSIGDEKKKGMEQPVVYWVPSISPSGMTFYTGDKIPEWKNNLFLGNLSGQHLRRLVLEKGKIIKQEVLFEKLEERFRQVRTGPDGYLYFSTDSGKIFKVMKK